MSSARQSSASSQLRIAVAGAGLGVPHYESLDTLLHQDKPDAVILATPNHLHMPGALLCAQHGVPALIEKPVADTLEAGQQLADALAASPVPMLVGHHRRHGAILRRAREAIRSGQLGRVSRAG